MAEGLNFREKGIYRLANAGLLAGVALFGGEQLLGIGSLTVWLVTEAVVTLGLLAGINFLPLRGKFFCLSAAALGVVMAVSAAGAQESLLFLRSYFPWLMGTGEGYEQWAEGYAFLQTAIIVILCYLLQIILEKVSHMKTFFAALLLAAALFCLFEKKAVPHWGMAFGFCYVVTAYAEWAEGRWKKVRGGSRRAYMLRILPFLAVYVLLMGCMPAPETPFQWKMVKNIYHHVREILQAYTQEIKWGDREGFGMAFSGFSEEAQLGGDLRENSRQDAVMTVQLPGTTPVNVYLTGTVYDTFDGREWQQSYQGDPEGVFLDAEETLSAAESFGGQYRSDYIHNVKLKIRYQDFNTGYVFAPLKTWEIKSEEEGFAYTGEGGSLRLERRQGYGTVYELQYYQMNGGQEEFYRFLEECSGGDGVFAGEMRYADERAGEETGKTDLGDTAVHRQDVYEYYLGEVKLSEAVREYLDRITQEAETDVEKLRALERELASFTYTQTPGELPERVADESEFLDYFLLESRQGYCTYFATAFVLLARAEGIPARYVQGFCVPTRNTGEVNVYSSMAHAWPEVYLSGVGWIPFEPTPGYREIRFTPWELRRPEALEASESDPEDGDGDMKKAEEEFEGEDEENGPKEPSEAGTEDEDGRPGHWLRALGYMVPVVLAGYVLLLLLDNAWGRYRYRRMCPEERFKLEIFRNLRILALLGLERGEQETLQELRDRCGLQSGPAALGFIDHYESVVYGGRSVSEEMIAETAEERRALLEQLKQVRRWAYIRWQIRSRLIRYR